MSHASATVALSAAQLRSGDRGRGAQYAHKTYNGAWIFAAGLITAAYVGLVVGILLYVLRHKL